MCFHNEQQLPIKRLSRLTHSFMNSQLTYELSSSFFIQSLFIYILLSVLFHTHHLAKNHPLQTSASSKTIFIYISITILSISPIWFYVSIKAWNYIYLSMKGSLELYFRRRNENHVKIFEKRKGKT